MSIAEIIDKARGQGRTVLNEIESKQVLAEAGLPVVPARLARTQEEAVKLAQDIGFPVVLKVVSPDISHKTEVGGIRLGLGSPQEVAVAFDDIAASVRQYQPSAKIEGLSVQAMAPAGIEVIMGMTKDPQFGPLLMFGLGGILVEVLRDVAFRIVPLTPKDAQQMVREIKGYPILEGYRGQPQADMEALERLLLRLSQFVEAHPEVEELDLNPVFAYPDRAVAVDARIVIG